MTDEPQPTPAQNSPTSILVGNLKSKTSWFSVALIVLGTLNDATDLLKQILPQNHLGAIMAGIGLVTLVLRNITSQSIAQKAS